MRTRSTIRTINKRRQKNNQKERSKVTTVFKQVIQTVQIAPRCVQYRKLAHNRSPFSSDVAVIERPGLGASFTEPVISNLLTSDLMFLP